MHRFVIFFFVLLLSTGAYSQPSTTDDSPPWTTDEPLFKWKVGMHVGIHAMLLACNRQFPETLKENEAAYRASVFSHPKGDEFLATGVHDFEINKSFQKIIDAQRDGVELILRQNLEGLRIVCYGYPQHIQRTAISIFGIVGGQAASQESK